MMIAMMIALMMIVAATTTGGVVDEDMVAGGVIAVSGTIAGAKAGGFVLVSAYRPSDDDLVPVVTYK